MREWDVKWIKWQGEIPIGSISVNKLIDSIVFPLKFKILENVEFQKFKKKHPNAYNGNLTYLEGFNFRNEKQITTQQISFDHLANGQMSF